MNETIYTDEGNKLRTQCYISKAWNSELENASLNTTVSLFLFFTGQRCIESF